MDDLDRHVIDLFLCDFEQCGIHLDQQTRKNVVYLNDCILRTGQRFAAGAMAPRNVPADAIPINERKLYAYGDFSCEANTPKFDPITYSHSFCFAVLRRMERILSFQASIQIHRIQLYAS